MNTMSPASWRSWLRVLLMFLAFTLPIVFYLRTYDSAMVKITMLQLGVLAAVAVWLWGSIEEGRCEFPEKAIPFLTPAVLLMAWNALLFCFSQHRWASLHGFVLQEAFLASYILTVVTFSTRNLREPILAVLAGWAIVVGYGALQWVDYHFFSPGIGNGIDPFIWRGAYGEKVFSTLGNPNFLAGYLLLCAPLAYAVAIDKELPRWARLSAATASLLGSAVLVWSKYKLGIVAYPLLTGAFMVLAARMCRGGTRRKVLGLTGACLFVWLAAGGFSKSAPQEHYGSKDFLTETWKGTWALIKTSPWVGHGPGSFWVAYPAVRRPQIFLIEGKHNTETDHAENEVLEQWVEGGLPALALWLWLFGVVLSRAWRRLRESAMEQEKILYLAGLLTSVTGGFLLSMRGVGLRFTEPGWQMYFAAGLLSAVLVSTKNAPETVFAIPLPWGNTPPTDVAATPSFPLRLMRLVVLAGLLYMLHQLTGLPRFQEQAAGFAELQGPFSRLVLNGEKIQWLVAWLCFGGCVAGLAFLFTRIIHSTRNPLSLLVVLAMLYPLNLIWGFFRADVYHNIAIFYSKQRDWGQALTYYRRVGELNPGYIMSSYFRGNVYNDRFDMQKVYKPEWGDPDGVVRDDYERALASYDAVRRQAPNYVQMHHQVGALHLKRAEWAENHGNTKEAQDYYRLALNSFEAYHKIDPVFGPNYFRMGHIYMKEKRYGEAVTVYAQRLEAPGCLGPGTELISYHECLRRPEGERISKNDGAEAYINLGNAYFMMGNSEDAKQSYQQALQLDSKNKRARDNLARLKEKKKKIKS